MLNPSKDNFELKIKIMKKYILATSLNSGFAEDGEDLLSSDEQTEMFNEIVYQSLEKSNLNWNKYSNLIDTVAKKIVTRLNGKTRNKNGIYHTCKCFNDKTKTIKRNVPDRLNISGCKSREIFTLAKQGYCPKADLHLNNKLTLDNYIKINKFIDSEVKINQSITGLTINDLKKALNERGYLIESNTCSGSGSQYVWLSKIGSDELEFGVRISDHSLNDNNYLGAGVVNFYEVVPNDSFIEDTLTLITEYEKLKSEYGNVYSGWVWSERSIYDMNSIQDEPEFYFKL
jgi:hypothetical protein